MTLEQYKQAKYLREQIQHFETKKHQIKSTKNRDNDEDFNMLRQLAFDGCEFARASLEKQFENL